MILFIKINIFRFFRLTRFFFFDILNLNFVRRATILFKGTDFPTELRKYNIGRSNLILIAVLTAINIFLLATKDYTYFYFSAAIPYIITDLAMFYTGMYPEEFYSEYLQDATFLPPIIFALALFISVAIIAVYILCFIMSGKQRKGFLICGLVLFAP